MTVLDAQIAALAKCQDDSGLWHTLLDDPHSYPRGLRDRRLCLRHSQSGAQALRRAALCRGG